MSKPELIYLDMDGVLCDFISDALDRHDAGHVAASWPPGVWSLEHVLHLSADEVWKPLRDIAFWQYLDAYDHAHALVQTCRLIAPTKIVTTPGPFGHSAHGKMAWLDRELGRRYGQDHWTDYHFTHAKAELATPNRILIDDSDRNCDEFRAAGGRAILFPRPWNREFHLAGLAFETVLERLEIECKESRA